MRRFRVIVTMAVIASLWIGVSLAPQPTAAADITVGRGGYECTRDGLADAILNASPGGTITFECNPATFDFGSGDQITIDENINIIIDGSNNGTPITLDGHDTTRFFTVTGGKLTLQHLTLKDGAGTSGAIRIEAAGAVDVIGTTFYSNRATESGGAIDNRGTLFISQSTFDSNWALFDGGAIQNYKNLIIERSSFVNNHADELGGVIETWTGSVTISASTMSGNTARLDGSSIFINVDTQTVLVLNTTIIQPEGARSTLYAEGNGILSLHAVILSGSGRLCRFNTGGTLTDSYTFSSDASCNLQGTGSRQNVANLGLGPLTTTTINGVEQSYYPLLQGSPAIDGSHTAACPSLEPSENLDQIGNPRPQGATCDIGAIESPFTGPQILCANTWNGALSYDSPCARSSAPVLIAPDEYLNLCVNTWNSATRLSDRCTRSERYISVSPLHTIPICVNKWTSVIRATSHCTRSETTATL